MSRYFVFYLIGFIVVSSFVFLSISEKYDGYTGMAGGGGATCEDAAWETCIDNNCVGQTELYAAGGTCVAPGVCCRTLNYCGDSLLDPGESCDGALLGGNDCTDVGFYGGTLACSSCEFDNSSCTGYCGDGTCDAGEETCNGCPADCENITGAPACSAGLICEVVLGSGGCVAPAPSTCSDGTGVSNCVAGNAPQYCDADGNLVNDCASCPCGSEFSCQSDGQCSKISSGPSGESYSADDAVIVENEVEINDQIQTSYSSFNWDGLRRNDEITFDITQNSDSNQMEEHRIEIDSVSGSRGYVDVIIYSDPINVRLYDGIPREIDLDGDGVIDIIVTASDIRLSTFNINVEEYVDPSINGLMKNEIEGSKEVYFEIPSFSPRTEVEEYSLEEFLVFVGVIFGCLVFMFTYVVRDFKNRK